MTASAIGERPWYRHYDEGVPRSIDYEELTLYQAFQRTVQRFGDRPALVFMNCRLTYAQLAGEVRKLAAGLASLGVGPGTRVAVHLPNVPQTNVAVLAIMHLGGHVVMTNPLYVPREIEHQWNDADVQVAITGGWLYQKNLAALRPKLPVKHYVITHVPEYLRFPLNLLAPLKLKKEGLHAKVAAGPGIVEWKALMRAGGSPPPMANTSLDDLALLQYTGGTTGLAKGVMLSHRNLSCHVQQLRSWLPGLREGHEVCLGSLPYFHVFGFTVAMLLPVWLGALVVLMPNPRDIPRMVSNVAKHRVTLFPAVPALFNALNQFPGIENVDVSSIRACVSGSAPLPEDVLRRFEQLTGAKIVEGFGMTESSPCTHCNPIDGLRKVGAIGVPLPDTDARIVDPEDGVTDLPVGKEGELIVRGPQVMLGYWKRDDATRATLRDGWLYTGDLAVVDDDGFYRIVGRKKDMILASGYNVYPDEIDRVLTDHPAVFEACTIGIPDPKRGETVKSFVVLLPGKQATSEELIAHCRENLAAYKVPREIEFRTDLPKSSMMKLLRRELRDEEIRKRGG